MTPSAEHLNALVSRKGLYRVQSRTTESMRVPVVIIDARVTYGRIVVRVRPDTRETNGAMWVNLDMVDLKPVTVTP